MELHERNGNELYYLFASFFTSAAPIRRGTGALRKIRRTIANVSAAASPSNHAFNQHFTTFARKTFELMKISKTLFWREAERKCVKFRYARAASHISCHGVRWLINFQLRSPRRPKTFFTIFHTLCVGSRFAKMKTRCTYGLLFGDRSEKLDESRTRNWFYKVNASETETASSR